MTFAATIALERARAITAGAFAGATKLGLRPLSVLGLAAGGQLVSYRRRDGSSRMRFQIAMAKARVPRR